MDHARQRVLVIDDNADVRSMIQALLESEGYAVSVAGNGREGMQLQRSNPAPVVVTDVFMPDKDGIETVYEMLQEFPQTKIVVVSGGTHRVNLNYGRVAVTLGACKFLHKPFHPQELVDAVHELAASALE